MDPDAVDLRLPASVARERPAPSGRDRGETAAPRHELHFAVVQKRLVDVDPDSPHEPQMRRRSPAGLLNVVDRDVLKQACQRVQPDAAARVDVGEPYAPARRERPSVRREQESLDRARRRAYPADLRGRRTLPLQSARLISRRFACFCRRATRGCAGGRLAARLRHTVRMRGLEPPRPEGHTDLNRARLPIPPHPRGATV